ncbi:uncharacterized protein [Arachis hypogaea]|uniref:uncharacterized protein n=1 Tax=Arachis hypogaea TaxID=3818 RepID=UPI003B20B75D
MDPSETLVENTMITSDQGDRTSRKMDILLSICKVKETAEGTTKPSFVRRKEMVDAMHVGNLNIYLSIVTAGGTEMKVRINSQAVCVPWMHVIRRGRTFRRKKMKVEHQKPSGMLQFLGIPQWKWGGIAMDFVTGLPRTRSGFDAVWLIMDRLTKSAHFLPIRVNYSMEELARLYIKEIVMLHGVPSSIVSDRDPQFTSRFWGAFQRVFGTKLCLSTAYHPQTDGQSERNNQTLEDMLRACVLDQPGSWDPSVLGPDLIAETTENIKKILARILTAQSRQKSYADQRRKLLEFEVGEHVLLRVTPTTGIGRAIKTKKLNPRYTSDVAYVLEPESVELRENLTFQVTPVRIDDTSIKRL